MHHYSEGVKKLLIHPPPPIHLMLLLAILERRLYAFIHTTYSDGHVEVGE